MTAWSNVIFSGFIGACLIAGCTVTTGNGNGDGGLFEGTGGTSGTGGSSGITGGSASTGGTTGAATTVIECAANYVAPATPKCGDNGATTSCDSCLQTYHCADVGVGGDKYKACFVDSHCIDLINSMMVCMVTAFEATGVLPDTADADCQASTGMAGTGVSASTAAALWAVIQGSLDCSEVCCATITQ